MNKKIKTILMIHHIKTNAFTLQTAYFQQSQLKKAKALPQQ